MAFAITIVSFALIGVSYAVFFDVRTNSKNQIITAGTLKLTLSGLSNTPLSISEPIPTSVGLVLTPISYTVNHDSNNNLPPSYSMLQKS